MVVIGKHFHSLGEQGFVEFDYVLVAAEILLERHDLRLVYGQLLLHLGIEYVPVTVAKAVDGLFDITHHKTVLAVGQALPQQQV